MKRNDPLRRLQQGEVVLGTFVLEFASTGIARVAASAGAEFLVFDQEHTGWSSDTIRTLLASARGVPISPIVRVPTAGAHGIGLVLALGAAGVMVPMVASAEEARAIVAAAKYPPAGRRGFAVLHVDEHGGDVLGYMRRANEEVLVIAMIETREGLADVDRIAAVDGVDVLWVGHYDLSAALGCPGEFDHPHYVEAIGQVAAACARAGKAAGMSVETVDDTVRLIDLGYRFLAFGHDLVLLRDSLERGLAAVRLAIDQGASHA